MLTGMSLYPIMEIITDSSRHVVTNHLLHFLALDRSDPKKFQILQLIAALLQWDDGKHYSSPLYNIRC